MNKRSQDPFDPRHGYLWPPTSKLPLIGKQASVRGLRPTNRKATDHHPIAPKYPFPPDPYIRQFKLSEALQTGTLFRWLHTPDEDESKEGITTEKETGPDDNSQSEEPKPGS